MIVGHVYVVHTTLTKPPKDKITICICAADNLFLWINTKPRPHGIGQLPLAADDHNALSHDCHLDCSRATTFPGHELKTAQQRERISAALAQKIVQYLTTCPPKTLTPKHLKLAIDNLTSIA